MQDRQSSKLLHRISKRKVKSKEYLKYKQYIKSKAFREIREIILKRDNYQCQVCNWKEGDEGERTLTVHHRTYEHLYNEMDNLNDLICLCSVCHKAIHSAKSNYRRFAKTK